MAFRYVAPSPYRRPAARCHRPWPSLRWPALLALLLAGWLALAGCRAAERPPALAAADVEFSAGALTVHLPPAHPWSVVELRDAGGGLLLSQTLPLGVPLPVHFEYGWAPREPLTLLGLGAEGRRSRLTLTAPQALPPPLSAALQLPWGLDAPAGGAPLLLPIGSGGDLGLALTSDSDAPLLLRVRLLLPPALAGAADKAGISGAAATSRAAEGRVLRWNVLLRFRADTAQLRVPFRVSASANADTNPPVVAAGADDALAWEIRDGHGKLLLAGSRRIAPLAPSTLRDGLFIGDTHFPTDAVGQPQPQLPAEAWMPEHPAVTWLWRHLGAGAMRDPYAPAAYASHSIHNRFAGDIVVAVGQRFAAVAPPGSATAFANPLRPAADGPTLNLVRIPAHGSARVTQPVWLDESRSRPGIYTRCVELAPWGLADAAAQRCVPFEVRVSPLGTWLAIWLATLSSLGLLAWALARLQRWARAFALRDLVLIALSAGMAFLLVSVPNVALQALTTFLLGPFFFLLNDLLFKGLFFLLTGVLVGLVRRPGTFLLYFAIWVVAQAVLNGHYAPTVLLFAGISVLLIEAALWLGGITRAASASDVPQGWRCWLAAVLVGLAEGVVIVWHLALIKALYRVFLADWFVLLQGVSGGVHAAIGMGAGLYLAALLLPLRRPAAVTEVETQPQPPSKVAPPALPVLAGSPAGGRAAAAVLEAERVTFGYPGAAQPALCDVRLSLHPGELVLLGGTSGSGKTTLLRILQGLLPRQSGMLLTLCGQPVEGLTPAERARRCGLLFQEPALQIVRPTVRGELELARQVLGAGADTGPLEHSLQGFGIEAVASRPVAELSGGELQRVALAGLCAGHPAVLLLDEPLAHQDAEGRARLLAVLRALRAAGTAVLVAEHRLEPLLGEAQRVLWLEAGHMAWAGTPAEFRHSALARAGGQALAPARLRPPGPAHGGNGQAQPTPGAIVSAQDVCFAYPHGTGDVLRGLTVHLQPGRRVALEGLNGAGKSTLFALLLGLRKPGSGRVHCVGRPSHRLSWRERGRRFGYLPQQAELILHARTVRDELAFGPRRRGLDARAVDAVVASWLARLRLEHAAGRFPHLLSRGERQRLALAAVLTGAPQVLLLDEPFGGQDSPHIAAMLRLCSDYLAEDPRRSLLLATHDLELVRPYFDEIWTLRDGVVQVAAQGSAAGGPAAPMASMAAGGGA